MRGAGFILLRRALGSSGFPRCGIGSVADRACEWMRLEAGSGGALRLGVGSQGRRRRLGRSACSAGSAVPVPPISGTAYRRSDFEFCREQRLHRFAVDDTHLESVAQPLGRRRPIRMRVPWRALSAASCRACSAAGPVAVQKGLSSGPCFPQSRLPKERPPTGQRRPAPLRGECRFLLEKPCERKGRDRTSSGPLTAPFSPPEEREAAVAGCHIQHHPALRDQERPRLVHQPAFRDG